MIPKGICHPTQSDPDPTSIRCYLLMNRCLISSLLKLKTMTLLGFPCPGWLVWRAAVQVVRVVSIL